jgi:hypothetical protein
LEILGEVLALLLQLLFEVGVEIALELGLAGIKEALGRENRNPVLAAVGYLTFGVILGLASMSILPRRLFGPGPIPGVSLVVGPVIAGAVMATWGRIRRSRGHVTTNLATFLGGAAFALGIAIVRFWFAR